MEWNWLTTVVVILLMVGVVGLVATAFSMAPEMGVELQTWRRKQWATFRAWLARKVGG